MTVSTLVIAAVYPPLELSVRYYFFHRRTAGNNSVYVPDLVLQAQSSPLLGCKYFCFFMLHSEPNKR